MNKEADMVRAWADDLYEDVRSPNRSDVDFLYRHLDAALKEERRLLVDRLKNRFLNEVGREEGRSDHADRMRILDEELSE